MSKELEKDTCPICGYRFDLERTDKKEIFNCPVCNEKNLTKEQLITSDDDYAWVY